MAPCNRPLTTGWRGHGRPAPVRAPSRSARGDRGRGEGPADGCDPAAGLDAWPSRREERAALGDDTEAAEPGESESPEKEAEQEPDGRVSSTANTVKGHEGLSSEAAMDEANKATCNNKHVFIF